ncbi:hypothetical protein [Treponema sp.]|uniref:hypothetical protein n=1 Tax=Treponema sp. TaxID=166 RepID=UPI003F04FF6E
MNRKVFYLLYVLISSAASILFTLFSIGALFGVCFLLLKFVFHAGIEAYANAVFGCFTIGFVLSFFLYSKITTKIIKKYSLYEKFGVRAKKGGDSPENSDLANKTVLPDSVKEIQEDEKWRE